MTEPVRNPERVMLALRAAVDRFQGHLRIGQIISNAMHRGHYGSDDPFYIEDDKLAEMIEDFTKAHGG